MTSVNDPLIGHALGGRYLIVRRIARGGMATVYEAQDTRLTRTVAVKVMHEGLGDDADFTRKFDREARAAAHLIHPNVVAVFDQGIDADRPYIVMEYVAGSTLRALISREAPLDARRTLELMEPVLAALAAAHAGGFVHRDVKPENVLISERGHVKVADFGLAKAISGDTATATQGLLIGTVSYIPPELVSAGHADERSDVYSAGIVLFELLTGRKPHTGDTPIQVAWSHCHNDVPAPSSVSRPGWRESRPAIPRYVDELVRSATARDPGRRPANARVLLDHLRLARQALERGVTADARLDREMWANAARPQEERTVVAGPVRQPSPDSPTVAIPRAVRGATWQARGRTVRATPSTPVSPVDFEHTFDGMTYYDDLAARAPERTERDTGATAAQRPRRERPQPVGRAEVRPTPKPEVARIRPAKPPRPIRQRRQPQRWRGLVALLLVLLVAGGAGYGSWWALAGRYTNVPTLTGLQSAEAREAARSAGLVPVTLDQFSETVPAGVVIDTNPGGGARADRGSTVTLAVSKGPERYAVPSVVGQPKEAALAALAGANLAPGAITEDWSDTVAAGSVIAANPSVGTQLKPQSGVDLVVSKGRQPIAIPALTGRKYEDAKAALEKAGFQVKRGDDQFSKTVPAGSVISQSPASGQGYKGDTVTLVVSKGPVLVTVPNVRWMNPDDAAKALTDAGFTVKRNSAGNPLPLNIVSYTDPAGGSQAPEGSTITLYIA